MVPAMKKWLSWTRKNVLVKHLLHIKLLCSGRVGYAVVGLSYEFSLSLRLGGRTNNPRVRVTVGGGMANAPQIKKLIKKNTLEVFTPWTIRYVIRYFSFNMLRRRPAMHIEGFNMHALEGAIHIGRSISFVAVAAICIDKTNIF